MARRKIKLGRLEKVAEYEGNVIEWQKKIKIVYIRGYREDVEKELVYLLPGGSAVAYDEDGNWLVFRNVGGVVEVYREVEFSA